MRHSGCGVPEDLLGRAGTTRCLGYLAPIAGYDLFLIVVGPLVTGAAFALARTRFGRLIRAATQIGKWSALGVNRAILFTVFALGAALAGFGGHYRSRAAANSPPTWSLSASLCGGGGWRYGFDNRRLSCCGHYAEVKAICIGIGVVDFWIL